MLSLPNHSCPTALSVPSLGSGRTQGPTATQGTKRTRLEQTNWLRLTESSWPRLISKMLKQKGGSTEIEIGSGRLQEDQVEKPKQTILKQVGTAGQLLRREADEGWSKGRPGWSATAQELFWKVCFEEGTVPLTIYLILKTIFFF